MFRETLSEKEKKALSDWFALPDEKAERKVTKNKHALLSMSQLETLQNKIILENKTYPLTSECKLWELIQETLTETNHIHSCDLPSNPEENAVLVLKVQKQSDAIFKSADHSQIEKIMAVADLSLKATAGNCQEKAFAAFKILIEKLIKAAIANPSSMVPLTLGYFHNHFVLCVDNQFLVDPWINAAFPIADFSRVYAVYEGYGHLQPFFMIDKDWNCFFEAKDSTLTFDEKSTAHTFSFFTQEPKKPAPIKIPSSSSSRDLEALTSLGFVGKPKSPMVIQDITIPNGSPSRNKTSIRSARRSPY